MKSGWKGCDPCAQGFELVVGKRDGNPTLTIRDGQHDYVLTPE